MISASGLNTEPQFESRFSSRDYGNKQMSQSVCWKVRAGVNLTAHFVLVPLAQSEDESERWQQTYAGIESDLSTGNADALVRT